MPKAGEYTYYEQIGEEGREHAVNKPFSDSETPRYLLDAGALFSLLPPPPGRILDCGCGTGWLSYFLARKGYSVVGQDCANGAIELARENPLFVKEADVEFICSDFEQLDFEDEFDAVVFYASLHHSQEEEKTIRCAYRALKKGGVFIAVEPGSGHGAKAQATIDKYDLGDRDMPPTLVIKLGKQMGFSEHRIYQHPGQLTSALYNGQPHSARLKKLWKIPGVRLLFFLGSLLFYKRYNGLVWMKK